MKNRILILGLLLLSFVGVSQTRTTSGNAIRKEITPKFVNGLVKQYTISKLRQLRPSASDSSTVYYSTDSGKEGVFKYSPSTSLADDGENVLVCQNLARLTRLGYVQREKNTNTILGSSLAGSALTTATKSLYLGNYTGSGRETLSNQIALSDGDGNVRAINNAGNWLVGKTVDAGYNFDLAGSLRNEGSAYLASNAGSVGIGTLNPSTKLHVIGNVTLESGSANTLSVTRNTASSGFLATVATFRHITTSSETGYGGGTKINLSLGVAGASEYVLGSISGKRTNSNTLGQLVFAVANAPSSQTEIVTMQAEGSSALTITSTTQGFLPPRLSTEQINAIVNPVAGLTVYNTGLATLCFYDGTAWRKVSHSAM